MLVSLTSALRREEAGDSATAEGRAWIRADAVDGTFQACMGQLERPTTAAPRDGQLTQVWRVVFSPARCAVVLLLPVGIAIH